MKLNDNFSAIRSNILMMTPLLTVNQAYRLVVQEEYHKDNFQRANHNETIAFVADRKRLHDNYSGFGSGSNSDFKFQPSNSQFPQ